MNPKDIHPKVGPPSHPDSFGQTSDFPEYLPGELVFKVHPGALQSAETTSRLQPVSRSLRGAPEALAKPLEYLLENVGLKPDSIAPMFLATQPVTGIRPVRRGPKSLAALGSRGAAVSKSLAGIFFARVDDRELTPALLKKLNSDPRFEYVERVPAYRLCSPLEPRWNTQWGLAAIRRFNAPTIDASEIGVAVLDTGLDIEHPDFAEVSSVYDHSQLSPTDRFGHGTHVAGIVAAGANPQVGTSGVAQCALYAFKVFDDGHHPTQPIFNQIAMAAAVTHCLEDHRIRVLNLSFSGADVKVMRELITSLTKANKVVVAAAGNDYLSGNPTLYPAAYKGVIAVGSVDAAGHRAPSSCTGPHVALVAPGAAVLSTVPGYAGPSRPETGHAVRSGTSMAAPHVAGAVALLLAQQPHLTPAQVRRKLTSTARKLPGMPKSGRNDDLGAGLLDLERLLGDRS